MALHLYEDVLRHMFEQQVSDRNRGGLKKPANQLNK